jgi:hypothetical protein
MATLPCCNTIATVTVIVNASVSGTWCTTQLKPQIYEPQSVSLMESGIYHKVSVDRAFFGADRHRRCLISRPLVPNTNNTVFAVLGCRLVPRDI